jgi:hypothetical protein
MYYAQTTDGRPPLAWNVQYRGQCMSRTGRVYSSSAVASASSAIDFKIVLRRNFKVKIQVNLLSTEKIFFDSCSSWPSGMEEPTKEPRRVVSPIKSHAKSAGRWTECHEHETRIAYRRSFQSFMIVLTGRSRQATKVFRMTWITPILRTHYDHD